MVAEVVMPKAGLTMVEGTIMEWKTAEGAAVVKGDVLMEYENEKSTIECLALGDGILHITAKEGETIPIGQCIGYLADTQTEYDALVGTNPVIEEKGCARECETCVHPAPAALEVPAASVSKASADGFIRASGLAKKMAAEAGIDLAQVPAANGRIQAKDVDAYLERLKRAPSSASYNATEENDEVTVIPWTGVRKAIARNMYNSLHETAQCTCTCECDFTNLLAFREKLVAEEEHLGCKITVNDLLCKMLGKVIKNHPYANATFDGDTLYSHKHVHLSVAVGTEDGLMVPVVRNVDALSLTEIHFAVKDLAQRAKEKKLTPDEQTGGTFTITNVGMYPIDDATPVINPPQVAICGFGRSIQKPRYMADGSLHPRWIGNIFLTLDHRVMDGLETGRIFRELQYYVEHPEMILV